MPKIVTSLWFDGRVEEAVEFYTSIFANSRITSISRYGEAGPGPKGEIMTFTFELEGQEFTIINGGPGFPHSPAISLRAIDWLLWTRVTPELSRFYATLTPKYGSNT